MLIHLLNSLNNMKLINELINIGMMHSEYHITKMRVARIIRINLTTKIYLNVRNVTKTFNSL